MANWGLLMGLGQGIQQVGGMLEARGKAQLADRLEQEKEARDAARKEAEYRRDQASYGRTENELINGQWMQVDYAKDNTRMEGRARVAPANLQTELTAAMEKSKADAKKSALSVTKLEDEVANLAADRDLNTRYKEAQIKSLGDTGLARLLSAGNRGGASQSDNEPTEPTQAQMKDALKDRYSARFDKIAEDYASESASFSHGDLDGLINRAMSYYTSTPGAKPNDVDVFMDKALREYERLLKAKK